MKRIAVLAVVAIPFVGACSKGGNDDTAALKQQVAALQQQLATTTTTAAPTTTTTAAPTTTTTEAARQPQGTVEWTDTKPLYDGPPCTASTYHFVNRSDTAVLNVTISNVKVYEAFPDPVYGGSSWRVGAAFPPKTVAAGIPPYSETDLTVQWCGPKLKPGTTGWRSVTEDARFTWNWVTQ